MKQLAKVDAYIHKAQPFAQEILIHLRELVHDTCPDVEEGWKWSFPCFMYRGSILCSMAAFKEHCAFGFWLAGSMEDPAGILVDNDKREGMGHLGKLRSMADLPPDHVLKAYIHQAMELNERGVKLIRKSNPERPVYEMPAEFNAALQANKTALQTWENFSPSCRREYLEWICEAKTQPTRDKRMAQTLVWLEEGKKRNWAYEKKR